MRPPSTYSPEHWRQLHPKNWYEILPYMQKAGITLVPKTFPEPSKHNPPVELDSLTNVIIYHAKHENDVPFDWEVYLYLDSEGFLSGVYTSPDNILRLAHQLNLKIWLVNEEPVMPDKIGNTEINSKLLRTAIEALVRDNCFEAIKQPDATRPHEKGEWAQYGDWKWVQYENYSGYTAGGHIAIPTKLQQNYRSITSIDGIKYVPIRTFEARASKTNSETYLFARYAALMLKETINQKIDIRTLPTEWQTLYKLLYPKIDAKFIIASDSEIWKILTRIERPEISREPENESKNSFDFIETRFGMLSTDTIKNRNEIIKNNIKDMIKLGYNVIQSSSAFERFGVPISILTPTRYAITRQSELIITYEIKPMKRKEN